MAARLLGFAILGIAVFVLLVVAAYLLAKTRTPEKKHEMDVSSSPSWWYADSRSIRDNTVTEISIVRVDSRHEVLERRVLEHVVNGGEDYASRLDAAQDRAYEAQRKANVGLTRR